MTKTKTKGPASSLQRLRNQQEGGGGAGERLIKGLKRKANSLSRDTRQARDGQAAVARKMNLFFSIHFGKTQRTLKLRIGPPPLHCPRMPCCHHCYALSQCPQPRAHASPRKMNRVSAPNFRACHAHKTSLVLLL